MKKPPSRDSRKDFHDEIRSLWPLAKGSLALVRRPCIRANCPACRSGKKHAMWIFSCMDEGRRRCLYVPKSLVADLRQGIANGRAVERLLSRVGAEWLRSRRLGRGAGETLEGA